MNSKPTRIIGRASQWWRSRRWWVRYSVWAVILIGGFYTVENIRGYLAWKTYRAAAEARGERFELEAFYPTGITDEENFEASDWFFEVSRNVEENHYPVNSASRPELGILRYPTGYEGMGLCQAYPLEAHFKDPLESPVQQNAAKKILKLLAAWDTEIENCAEAVRRPRRAALQKPERLHELFIQGINTGPIMETGRVLNLRIHARLALEQNEEALFDVLTQLKLFKHLADGGTTIDATAAVAGFLGLYPVIWEGLRDHRWNSDQLELLLTALREYRPLDAHALALRADRARSLLILNRLARGPLSRFQTNRSWGLFYPLSEVMHGKAPALMTPLWTEIDSILLSLVPGGWIHQNMVKYCEPIDLELAALREPEPLLRESLIDKANMATKSASWWPPAELMDAFTTANADFIEAIWRGECLVSMARTAVALELYRIDHQRYPILLGELLPDYLAVLPIDPFSGKPLLYQLNANGTPRIHSFGFNRTDENGRPNKDPRKGDFVWQYTLPPGFTEADYRR